MAWLIFPSSAVVMKPELSLSMAYIRVKKISSDPSNSLEGEDGSVKLICPPLLIYMIFNRITSVIYMPVNYQVRQSQTSPLCKAKEGLFLHES